MKQINRKTCIFVVLMLLVSIVIVSNTTNAAQSHRILGFARDNSGQVIENGAIITAIVMNHVEGSGWPPTYTQTTTVDNTLDYGNYDFGEQGITPPSSDYIGGAIYFHIGNQNSTNSTAFQNLGFTNLTILIEDIPQITDNSPDSGHTGDSFTFNVTVIDYVDSPAELRINVSWLHGTQSGNKTLTNTVSNYFAGSITLDNYSIANMAYIIWVNDTSGKHNHSTLQTVTVTDDEDPISHVSGISGYWKKASDNPLTITATASDNIGLNNVTLYYRFNNNGNTSWGSWTIYGVNITPWTNSGHPTWSFTFSSTGHYQFYTIAKDNATNAEVAPGSADAICGYDTVLPSSSVNAISPYWKTTTPVTITATASNGASGVKNVTLYYRFCTNNASWGAGWVNAGTDPALPWSWSFALSNGTGYYQFYSIAKDNATNVESKAQSAEASCGYDFSAPVTTVSTISPYWRTANTVITATVSSNNMSGIDTITLYCRNSTNNQTWSNPWVFGTADTDPWVSAQWTFTFPNLTGYYRFYSRGTDNATNTETLPGVDSPDAICGYDNVAPIATMTALSVYKNANFLVQWSVGVEVTSGVASWTVQCRNGSGGSWTAWLTNVSYTVRSATWLIANTTEGHMVSFRVLAVDNASNCGTWGASVSTTRDTVAPTSEVTDITPFWQNTSAITIQATASDGTSGLKYVVLYYYNSTDNLTWTGPWTSGNDTTPWSGVSWSFTFLSGSIHYRFYSRATDNATNTEGAPTTNDTICYYNNTYPNTPSSPSPANGTTYTTGDRPSGLSWTGGDINNDLVNYTLYVRASNSTLNASYIHGYTENVTSHSIIFSWSTTYYWKIVATDEHGAVSIGPIWHFTTGAESGGGGPGPSGAENTAPTAEAGGPYMEYVNATITFNASKSTDTDGRITGYKWDWTNDGTWDTDWLTNPTTTHVYTLVGSYTVKLQVKDNGSATDDDTASVTIQALPVIYASQEALDFLNSSFGLEFTTPFYGTDTNGDDVVDTFTDPNHLLTFVRFANVDGSASFLLSTGNDDIPEFFWDTTTNTITPVHHDVGAIIDTVDNTDTKTITMTISVEKANWTYIEVTDLYPDNPDLIVKTVDGRTISSEMLWRKNGKIFILDDPVTEYQIIYSYVGRSLFDVILELTPNSVHVGADISALITLINVGEPGLVNGTVNYTLYKGGEIVWSSEENVSVLSQKTFTKTISTDGLSLGSYTYKVIYSYSGGQTASAQGIFTVDAVQQPLLENILLWAVIIIIIIIIVIVAVLFKLGYLYFDKKEK